MKASLKSGPPPTEARRIATKSATYLSPTRLTGDDKALAFNTRLRASTIAAIKARARAEGAIPRRRAA
jgi:hypothetical protein